MIRRYWLSAALPLLFAPLFSHAITSVEALPSGVRALALIKVNSADVDSTLNASGYLESLVSPLNRSLTLDDFAKREPRLIKLRNVVDAMGEPGLAQSLLFADLTSSIEIQDRRTVGALFWGLTDRFSLGLIVPKITRDVNVRFNAEVLNQAAELKARFGDIPQLSEALDELAQTPLDTATFEEAIFTSNGYLPPRPFQASGLGDIELELRAVTFQNPWLDWGLRGTLHAPTAVYKPDLRNLFDRELGDGAWGYKLGTLHAVKVVPGLLTFHSAVFGTLHSPSHPTVALPLDPEADLANLNDPNQIETVRKRIGAQVDLDTGLELSLWNRLASISGSYQYSAKAKDKVEGTHSLDYARLMNQTDAVAQSTEWTLEFSTVPLFQRKAFPLPGKLSLLYHRPLAGRNSVYASYGRLDAILFF